MNEDKLPSDDTIRHKTIKKNRTLPILKEYNLIN